jgi:hypothetical protein
MVSAPDQQHPQRSRHGSNDSIDSSSTRTPSPLSRHTPAGRIYEWLQYCIENHEACHRRELSDVFTDDEEILLIDVHRLRLVRGFTNYQFVALSYVWGDTIPFETKKETMDVLMAGNNALKLAWNDIPRVVQDAITLTAEIGETYLWVDSICIVQDDADSKHHQLELMAEIYNRATATFIACCGDNASCSLITSDASKAAISTTFQSSSSRGLFSESTGPITSDIYQNILDSKHNKRGWTYQERLLSRRRFYFLDDRIIFHCRNDRLMPVETPTPPPEPPRKTAIEYHPNKLRLISQMEIASEAWEERFSHLALENLTNQGGPEWPKMSNDGWREGFSFWSRMVTDFSEKSLTFEEDVLRACTGILHSFQWYSKWPMNFGTPLPLLDMALHWTPKSQVALRQKRGPTTNITDLFPSWSWLCWKGAIDFILVFDSSKFCDFRSRLEFNFEDGISSHRCLLKVDKGKVINKAKSHPNPTAPAGLKMLQHKVLRFSALAVEASQFIVVPYSDILPPQPPQQSSVQNWCWLKQKSSLRPTICGVIFSSPTIDERTWNLEDEPLEFWFILLSDTRNSAHPIVNHILAPEIALNLLEDLGQSTAKWENYFTAHFSADEALGNDDESTQNVSDACGVPMGAIRNFMLVQRLGFKRSCRFRRVAIGQIVGRVWDKMDPQKMEVKLG